MATVVHRAAHLPAVTARGPNPMLPRLAVVPPSTCCISEVQLSGHRRSVASVDSAHAACRAFRSCHPGARHAALPLLTLRRAACRPAKPWAAGAWEYPHNPPVFVARAVVTVTGFRPGDWRFRSTLTNSALRRPPGRVLTGCCLRRVYRVTPFG